MDKIAKDIENLSKRQRISHKKILDNIDSLINVCTIAADKLSAGENAAFCIITQSCNYSIRRCIDKFHAQISLLVMEW